MAQKVPTKAVAKTAAPVPTKRVGTAVAPAGPTSLATVDESVMAKMLADAKKGNNFAKDDLAIPFLRVLQLLSPQVDKRNDAHVDGAQASMIIDTASKRLYPAEAAEGQRGVLFVPVWYTPSYVEFNLREDGGGFVRDFGPDASVLLKTERDEKNRNITPKGTQIVYSMMYFGFLVDEDEDGTPTGDFTSVVLPLAGTQLKKGRLWNTFIDKFRTEYQGVQFNPPSYYNAFRLTTAYESNDQGNWFGINWDREIATHDLPNGVSMLDQASQFRASLERGTAKAKMDEVVEAEITDDGEAAPRTGRADGGKAF